MGGVESAPREHGIRNGSNLEIVQKSCVEHWLWCRRSVLVEAPSPYDAHDSWSDLRTAV